MDAKARAALINTVSIADNFNPVYNNENRRWMVGKLLSVVESRVTNDAAIAAKTKEVVTKAKALVTKHRDFKISIKISAAEPATQRILRRRRVEILYGMIAHEPDLVDPANEKQLLFVARRRYRTIARFQFFINPNSRGYLRYDSTCPTNRRWRVNVDAAPFWAHVDAASDYPIKLKTPPDPPDIVTALKKFFTRKEIACQGNIFDCATALSVVYMDSLLEAKTPATFLQQLYLRDPPLYLSIDHVHPFDEVADLDLSVLGNLEKRNKYFLMDVRPTTLFNKTFIPQEDLQVGDHVYIHNHGLYKRLHPRGAWQGEHALVTDCGNRIVESATGFWLMGHGMPRRGETGGVPRFYANLLSELNTSLYRYYRIGAIFLFFKKSGDTAFPGDVTKETATATDIDGVSRTVDFYFFNVDFSYPNYMEKPPRGRGFIKTPDHDFVAWHIAATREFGIHEKKTIPEARTQGIAQFVDGVRFTRFNPPASPAEMFDPPEWGIKFPGNDGGPLDHFLFREEGAGLKPRLLEMYELYLEPFAKFDHPGPEIITTRPEVNVGSAYTTFLTSSGGI